MVIAALLMETMHPCPVNHNLTGTSTFNMPAL